MKITSFFKYLGATIKGGHFVCHVKHGQNFVTFNDSRKLELATDIDIENSLLYLYKKQEINV